jgi:hypothetical protein
MIKIFILGLVFTLSSVALGDEKVTVAKAYEKAANLNEASYVTEIVFDKSSHELSEDSQRLLKDLLSEAKRKGRIEEVKVMAWADAEYPKGGKLHKDQRELADNRGLEIGGYVRDLVNDSKLEVDKYNMAEHSTQLEKLFKTNDARVKRSLETAGLAQPGKSNMPKKSGRALVMVIVQ